MNSFEVKTAQNNVNINYYCQFVSKYNVSLDKPVFLKMCKNGCKNYAKKYSCPPFAPEFSKIVGDFEGLFIVMFSCDLPQISSTEYNKIRIANVIMKSRIDNLMRVLETKFKTIFLSNGSCRLCKPCKLKLNLPCNHPDKKRYSLEAVGVDCNKLAKELFDIELLWYKDKKAPEYTCVISGLVCNYEDVLRIEGEMKKLLG